MKTNFKKLTNYGEIYIEMILKSPNFLSFILILHLSPVCISIYFLLMAHNCLLWSRGKVVHQRSNFQGKFFYFSYRLCSEEFLFKSFSFLLNLA